MVDQEDMYLNIKINYNNVPMSFRNKELPSLDEIKNEIMKKLTIPNTKDYLHLFSKENKDSKEAIEINFDNAKMLKGEYFLEYDLSISDEVKKFKEFFYRVNDKNENKYNQPKNGLDEIIKENEVLKRKIDEMEKSKINEMEILLNKVKEMKKKIIKKEKVEYNNLKIELLKKELENINLKKYINDFSEKIKSFQEQINKFFENKKQTFEKEIIIIKDEIKKNQDNDIKFNYEIVIKEINNLKEGLKDLNEKNIKLNKELEQKKIILDENKSNNSNLEKVSIQNSPIFKGDDGKNLKGFYINRQSIDNEGMPQDRKSVV